MSAVCYVIRCISTNECEDEPLRCPTVPTTPSRPCEVVPTSRTLTYTKHISKKPPKKILTLCYVIRCISTNKCEGEPLRCPTVPTTPFRPCEVVPTSRTLAYTEHIISKKPPTKMVTLCYFIRCISTNECEGEPLRYPTVSTTPSRPREVVPTSRTLADTEHINSKKSPPRKC